MAGSACWLWQVQAGLASLHGGNGESPELATWFRAFQGT